MKKLLNCTCDILLDLPRKGYTVKRMNLKIERILIMTHDRYTSWTPFLQEAWEASGFASLSAIQEKTFDFIYSGRDVIAEAPTGSGKTLAYLLPLLQKIDPNKKQIQIVVVASSHELIMQIHQQIQEWSKGSGITSASLIGGANINRQIDRLKKKPQIVAGTPGRIKELITKKKLKMHEVQTLVLDEADQLLVPEHKGTIENIVNSTLKDRQILLFSATIQQKMQNLAMQFMTDPEIIRVHELETNKPKVDHVYIACESRDKIDMLVKITNLPGVKVLAFMRDIGNLHVLAEKLAYRGLDIGVLHSDTRKEQRAKALKTFRTSEQALLLATDVAARGLDIADLNTVVNMDLPQNTTGYIHRAGRTGRLGEAPGTVISLIEQVDRKRIRKFSQEMKITFQEKRLYKGKITDI